VAATAALGATAITATGAPPHVGRLYRCGNPCCNTAAWSRFYSKAQCHHLQFDHAALVRLLRLHPRKTRAMEASLAAGPAVSRRRPTPGYLCCQGSCERRLQTPRQKVRS